MGVKKGGIPAVAERLLELRDHHRLSSKQMYERMGIAKGTFSKYSTAQVAFDYMVLIDLIENFDCNPMWLLKGEGPMLLSDISTGTEKDEIFTHRLQNLEKVVDQIADLAGEVELIKQKVGME